MGRGHGRTPSFERTGPSQSPAVTDASTSPIDPGTADDWDLHWERFAESAEYNPAHAYRRRLIIAALGSVERGAPVLDIGSGSGDLAAALLRALPQPDVVGVELSATGVEIARRKVPQARFVCADLLSPAGPPEAFRGWAAYAVCNEVLEHVDDPAALLRAARDLLRPGARLITTVPGGPMSAYDRHIGHRRHYDADAVATVLDAAGFEVEWAAGAGLPFFNLYRLMVIALGRRLVTAAATEPAAAPGWPIRVGSRVYDALFRLNLSRGHRGWQTIASARAR